ncbi:MAG: PKD domain-containing protein [Candidatus Korarchaeota archaeon]
MRERQVSAAAFLILIVFMIVGNTASAPQVSVEFMVKTIKWGTYQTDVTPQPGSKNVPLTIIVQQRSSLYLRGVIGYLNLTEYFKDSKDKDNVATADGIAIETDNEARDIIPYGSFYMTFYLDISDAASKGEYQLNLRITGYAYNNTGYYEIIPTDLTIKVIIPNRAPIIKERDPDSSTVTVYLNETRTFKINAYDPDGDSITYRWLLDGTEVLVGSNEYTFNASLHGRGRYNLKAEVLDGTDKNETSWTINVPNRAPEIREYTPSDRQVSIYVGDNRTFSVYAEDPDGDNITYTWYLDGRKILSGSNATSYNYSATEDDVGSHTLTVTAMDTYGDSSNTYWTINVDVTSITEVKSIPEYVYSGRKYNVTILIWNNVWQGTVEVDISYPEYIAMFSNTHWTFRNVKPNDTITIELWLYAPAKVLTSFGEVSLIGQTLTLTVEVSFVDKYGRSYRESHTAEFIIRGEINLRLFSKYVKPEKITPGDTVTTSVTVLNVGVSSAQYANASILPADFIELLAESFVYIGAIEPGSPIPVLLKFRIKDDVPPGTYDIVAKICYFDDIYNENYLLVNFTIQVTPKETPSPGPSGPTIEEYLTVIYIGAIIAAFIALFLILRRRKLQTITGGV